MPYLNPFRLGFLGLLALIGLVVGLAGYWENTNMPAMVLDSMRDQVWRFLAVFAMAVLVPWGRLPVKAIAPTILPLALTGLVLVMPGSNYDSDLKLSHEVRFATANLYLLNPTTNQLPQQLNGLQADVLALVEVPDNFQFDAIASTYPYHHVVTADVRGHQALASKYPLSYEGQVGPGTVYTVSLPQAKVRVVVVHPTSPTSQQRQLKRNDELAHLMALPTDLPLVLLGDFNTAPHQKPLKLLQQGLGLVDTMASATWPSPFPMVRLDYVLTPPAWQLHGYFTAKISGSDHLAVAGDYDLGSK